MIRRGEIHTIEGAGPRSGPVLVVSSDEFNARERERPWVLGIVPAPPDTPDPHDALLVRLAPDDPIQGFVVIHDVRRPVRRWYRPEGAPLRVTPVTMQRVEAALSALLELP